MPAKSKRIAQIIPIAPRIEQERLIRIAILEWLIREEKEKIREALLAGAIVVRGRVRVELALSRPRATQTGAPSAQLTAPSIFDGITPPIGSVSDHLAAGGPEAPGIVPLESQPAVRKSTLQAAVLVQSVPCLSRQCAKVASPRPSARQRHHRQRWNSQGSQGD